MTNKLKATLKFSKQKQTSTRIFIPLRMLPFHKFNIPIWTNVNQSTIKGHLFVMRMSKTSFMVNIKVNDRSIVMKFPACLVMNKFLNQNRFVTKILTCKNLLSVCNLLNHPSQQYSTEISTTNLCTCFTIQLLLHTILERLTKKTKINQINRNKTAQRTELAFQVTLLQTV